MGRLDQRQIQKLAENKLKKILDAPERRALENGFSVAHANDSDEELYAYVVNMKRDCSELKAADVIGYRYLTQRLGTWPAIMTKVNLLLQKEKEKT